MNSKSDGIARWGTRLSDFRVGSKTRSSERTKQKAKQTDRNHIIQNRRPPTLASSLDELQTFASHVSQQCDSDDDIADTLVIDSDEEDKVSDSQIVDVEIERAAERGSLTLSPDDVQAFLDLLNQIGPIPSIQSRKFMN
jgi:hypothetical protein